MIVKPEQFNAAIVGMQEILDEYWPATAAGKDMPPLDMNWSFYDLLAQNGKLLVVTARDDDYMEGFVMYVVSHLPHHKSIVGATCDILATRLGSRNMGIGRMVMTEAENMLRVIGARYITHQFRTCYTDEPLFPKLGYKLYEQSYMKELT
jgi:GNAT superfamily N-acetyltransferase